MANKVIPTPFFLRRAKRLIKKFGTFKDTLLDLQKKLLENPYLGAHYGSNIYKIRVSDPSKGKGKSGGFRIITYIIDVSADSVKIYLVHVFDKSEEDTITKDMVKEIIKETGL